MHANRTRSVAAGRKSVGYVAALARAATKGVAVDGVAAEERDKAAKDAAAKVKQMEVEVARQPSS